MDETDLDGDGWMDAPKTVADHNRLLLHMDHYEGPLDLLLDLARHQKVDLLKISILELVEQYLDFIQHARQMRIELAADYLVMAAWLAYLKSRLLLPKEEGDEEPSAEELAQRLQLRLQRLDVMRDMGARLLGRNRLGRDVFARGSVEPIELSRFLSYDCSQFELLSAFAGVVGRQAAPEITIKPRPVYSLEQAVERLSGLLGNKFSWSRLVQFLPPGLQDERFRRSAIASMFAASLELAKRGEAEVRQMDTYGPLYIRRKEASDISEVTHDDP